MGLKHQPPMLESTAGIFKSRSSVVSKLEPTVALTLGDPGRAPCNTAIELTTGFQCTDKWQSTDSSARPETSFTD